MSPVSRTRWFVVAVLGLAGTLATARGEDAITPETVTAVKRATVFIRVQGPNWKGTGSGFVVASEKNGVVVATNYHVIASPGFEKRPRPTPTELVKSLNVPTVTAVFEGGTKAEESLKATVVAADPDSDLAILRIANVKAAPAPLDLAGSPKLFETMTVYSFGYPFGQALATGKGAPSVTVGKATISSLRYADNGELAFVQLDGSLNPGNSGGPVVDAKGRLVGVAVATVRNSQGIGLAVPAAEVSKTLKGRVGGFRVTVSSVAEGKRNIRAEVAVIDPTAALRGVTLHYLVRPKSTKPESVEALEKQPGTKKITLKIENGVASGEWAMDGPGEELLAQAVPDGGAGVDGISPVRTFSLAAPKPPMIIGKTPTIRPNPRAGRGPHIQGGGGDPEFRELAPESGVLVGLEVGLGKFFDQDVVKAVRPVFRTGETESFGPWHGPTSTDIVKRVVRVVAKPDHAVGAMNVKTGLGMNGLSLTFMKLTDGKLDPMESYESEWIASTSGRAVRMGDGTLIVGLRGKSRADTVSGLGPMYKGDGPFPAGQPSRILAGGGDPEFRAAAPAGGVLVGLEVGLGKFFDNDVVKAVRPVFRTGEAETTGEWFGTEIGRVVKLVAKPGYAIGAITAKTGLGVDGLSVTFMKLAEGKLDTTDSYESDWAGGKGGGGPVKVSGDGVLITGVAGKANPKDVSGIGLLLKKELPPSEKR